MKNIFILFITLVGLSQITYAQEFGAVANGTLNTFRSSESNDFKPLIGYGAGFYIEETYRQWSFLNEITFQRKGTNEEVNEDIKLKIDSKFIQVKIMFNYHFSEMSESKNSAFVGFGVYSGPRVDNRETFKIGEEEITNTEDITVIGFDAGVLLSVGYKINKISISGRTGLGLISIVDENTSNGKAFHQELFSLNLGYSFK